jgi:arabinofuranan 3-O-arabinosyltransferase
VKLPREVRAVRFRIDVLRAAAPAGATAADRQAVGIAEIEGAGARVPRSRAATLNTPCGTVNFAVGGAIVPMRVSGSMAAFDQGTPLRATACGRPVTLSSGTQLLVVSPGPFAVDYLRLSSPAARAPLVTGSSGHVVAAGTAGHGSYEHVRVSVSRPSWLVLGEGYNRGWQAFCDGRSLGTPTPVDGYANGWRVAPGCKQVRFSFAPNRVAKLAYLVSGIAGLLCLLALIGSRQWRAESRRTAARDEREPHVFPARPAGAPWPVGAALAAALAAGLVFGFVFGIAVGVASIPVTAFVLWRGVGARRLTMAAAVLLGVLVPLAYVLHPGSSAGGNHFGYAHDHLVAHYLAVAAIGLLIGALWRTLAASRGRRPRSGSRTSDASEPRSAPPAPAPPPAGSTGVTPAG